MFCLLNSMFRFIPVFVGFVWHHKIEVCCLFCMLYVLLWFKSGNISSVDVLLTRSHFTSHNFFSTAKKIIYIACSIQADFWLVKILTLSNPHKSSREFGGGAQGSSPTVAGNRAYIFWFWNHLTPVLNTRASHFNTWNTSNRSCLRCQAPMMTKVVSYCSMLIVIYY